MSSVVISFKCKVGEETFCIQINSESTIGDAKAALLAVAESALRSSSQKWIYQGKILRDEETIMVSNSAKDILIIH
jgi:hypothetical protein